MAGWALKRYLNGNKPLAILTVVLLVALFMMNAATQNSALFGRLYSSLLLVNLAGIVTLLALIAANLIHFVRQYRARAIGTRLTLRLFVTTLMLSVLPVAIVFMFSLQAINRGIDSWFDIKVEKALDDALLLGRTALDARRQDLISRARDLAQELADTPKRMLVGSLDHLREQHELSELALFDHDGRIIAVSAQQEGSESETLLPAPLPETVRTQIRRDLVYANLDPVGDNELRLRVVVPVYSHDVGAPSRALQIIQPLPIRYTKLGESVQSAFAEYEKLIYLRGPLKFGFTLTLSMVALIVLLLSLWASIVSARRLVAPIRDLAEGTQAVAEGDYQKRIPVPGHDELGVLVRSFNEMTERIAMAQSEIRRSQHEAEIQSAYLETVLTHLSSGVLSFDADARLRTHNDAAEHILRATLSPCIDNKAAAIAERNASLAPFCEILTEHIEGGGRDWQAEISLDLEGHHHTIIIMRGTRLPGLRGHPGGYVVVFDDISPVIQAQRDAAWAEVARRLAHEIKNPLTPIQLSAERIRHKCLDALQGKPRDTLDRATRTIVDQVESLKSMVNAFSNYARPVQMQLVSVNINDLVRDIAEMYSTDRDAMNLELELAPDLPLFLLDPGRLRQVLHNLLLNAQDALSGRQGGHVLISTDMTDDGNSRYLEIRVEDNGPGIPEAMVQRLFEPYVTNKEKGTGLGLAIVKKIIEEHNGTLEAYNNDKGACIHLRLPYAEVNTDHHERRA